MPRTQEKQPQAPSGDGVRERLHTLLAAGRARARSAGRPVLASTTERVTGLRALDVLDPRGRNQMYWAATTDGFAVAGIGTATTLTGSGESRFADVGRAWEQLVEDAVFHDAAYAVAGGPVLMGGFSFDPDGPHSATWHGFGAASFIVPRLSITCRPGECWLTLNALVDEDVDVEQQVKELAALRARSTDHKADLKADLKADPKADLKADLKADTEAAAAKRWRDLVADAVRTINGGHLEKVVLAREVAAALPPGFDVTSALRHLSAEHPNTFIYGIWRDDAVFFGASPERLVRLQGRDVSTSVLAGSAPRGETSDDDSDYGASLLSSEKERAEHEIVRREMETALMPVCDAVVVDLEPSLVSLAHVHHLHTSVHARLEDGRSVFDVVERLHPTPAVGGAPKAAALEFIREREDLDRGWYAAPVGWVSTTGAEFAVALRCSLVRRGKASLFAGCGIIALSDPDAEYEESQAKLRAAREALVAGSATLAGTHR